MMRFYTQQHPFYCGVDLHARSMHVCLVDAAGKTLVHKNIAASPHGAWVSVGLRRQTRAFRGEKGGFEGYAARMRLWMFQTEGDVGETSSLARMERWADLEVRPT